MGFKGCRAPIDDDALPFPNGTRARRSSSGARRRAPPALGSRTCPWLRGAALRFCWASTWGVALRFRARACSQLFVRAQRKSISCGQHTYAAARPVETYGVRWPTRF